MKLDLLNLIVNKLQSLIDKEISDIIEEQYQRAINLLENNKDKLTELAEVLLEKEVIFKDNLEKIFGERPFEKQIEERLLESRRRKKKNKFLTYSYKKLKLTHMLI